MYIPRLSVSNFFIPVLVFVISFSVYTLTASPFPVNIADSNELMTAAYERGLAHHPGYPIYVSLLSLLLHIPIGNPVYLANVSSSFFQSISLVLFYLCGVTILRLVRPQTHPQISMWASCISTLLLGFSYFFWDQATYAEVFGLNHVFVGLLLYLLLKNKFQVTVWIWGIYGFALAHHQIMLLLLPALLFLVLVTKQPQQWFLNSLAALMMFFLPYGLFFTFYRADASVSWFFDPSIEGFWQLISRGIYASNGNPVSLTFNQWIEKALMSIYLYGQFLVAHLSIPVVLLGLTGFYYLSIQHRRLFYFITIAFVFTGPLFAAYMSLPVADMTTDQLYYYGSFLSLRLLQMSQYVFALSVPLGIVWLSRYQLSATFGAACLVLVYLMVSHYPLVNKRSANFYSAFYEQFLTTLPQNSMVIIDSDHAFGLLFAQTVTKVRPDVLLIPTAMHMRWEYLQHYLPERIFKISGFYQLILSLTEWGLSESRPVYVLNPRKQFIDQMKAYHYYLTPYGYAFSITKTPQTIQSYDYGLSYQLAQQPPHVMDYWSRFTYAKFAATHALFADYYRQHRLEEGALLHLQFADNLRTTYR